MIMAMVTVTINGKVLSVPAGITVLQAARDNKIDIPTLCFMEKLDPHASCRMCVVEVEGARTLQHACATKVRDGMVVNTDTDKVRASRKMTLELLLSDHNVDCHHCLRQGASKCDDLDPRLCESCFFCDCERDGFCQLQTLAREYKVDVLPFTQKHNAHVIDATTAIVRNPNKCIKCKRCMDVCSKVQNVFNLSAAGRGCDVVIAPALGKTMAESSCIGCGRCAEVCPTGAIFIKEHKDEALYHAHAYNTETVCMLSDSVLPELEKLYRLPAGSLKVGQTAAALKKIGIDHIYSEANVRNAVNAANAVKLDERMNDSGCIIYTDTPAAKKFMLKTYPELTESCVFGTDVLSAFANEVIAAKHGAKRYMVSAENGFAQEAAETGAVDFFINSRELYRIFLRTGGAPQRRSAVETEKLFNSGNCGRYSELFADNSWEIGGEATEILLHENGRELRTLICHNPAQFKTALERISEYDIIKIIV